MFGSASAGNLERIRIALIDIPYAVVARHASDPGALRQYRAVAERASRAVLADATTTVRP